MVDKKYFAFSQYSNTPMLQYSNNSRGGKKNEKGVHVGSALSGDGSGRGATTGSGCPCGHRALGGQYMPIHPDVGGQKLNIQLTVTPVISKLIKGTLF